METQQQPGRLRALITGATSGIGLAVTRRLAALGVHLVLVARDVERLDAIAAEMRGLGVECDPLCADLATDDGIERVRKRLQDDTTPIDILVNSAGFGLGASFHHSEYADEQRLLRVLSEVPMALCHAALPGMRARGRGWILNVASMAAFLPQGTYSAAKAYVVSLSRSLRVQHRGHGIRVTAFCPGFVHTEFHERMGTGEAAPAWMWAEAETVAREAIRGLRAGKAIVRSDWRYRVLAPLTAVLPDRAKHAIMGR